ncbi:MAG: Unknown protein [uncultured Aureispira sp.]|uniref:Uncharacterized protein n=1 Tax=uncultured Aureispira sp. TaxID=1331704 RepID=A0A6S6SAR2_9BACT|nr:MAG: Unknown protein [uncultured Aureispira sp.]
MTTSVLGCDFLLTTKIVKPKLFFMGWQKLSKNQQ